MRNLLTIILFSVMFLASLTAYAVPMNSLFQASVPVATQSVPDKNKSLALALENVLIKVSGNAHVLNDNISLKPKLAQAGNYVRQTRYDANPEDKHYPYKLIVQFDPEAINNLLKDANVPVWGHNRPLILTWITLNTPQHPTDIIDSSNSLEDAFKVAARSRGLPVIFPIMDAMELASISASDIETQELPAIQKASLRYASDAILTGSIKQVDKDYTSHWQLIMGNEDWSWDVNAKTMPEVLSTIVDNIANTLAPRYATSVTGVIQSQVTLHVMGVKEQTDLLKLMKYLQQLSPVAEVQLENVNGDEIVLAVSLTGSQQALVKAISADKTLIAEPGTSAQDDVLQYKWNQ